jgi:hypothetical protein
MSFLLLLLFVSLCWTQEAIKLDLYLAEKERPTAQLGELYNRGLLSKSEYEDWKNRYERERATYLSLEAELKGVEKLIEYC